MIAALLLCAGFALQDAPGRAVLADLSPGAAERLEQALAAADGATAWEVEAVPEPELARRLGERGDAVAVVGYSLPALRALAEAGRLAAPAARPENADPALSDREGRFFALWIDPVVLAFSRRGLEPELDAAALEQLLPDDVEELGARAFEGRLRLAVPEAGNATGALLAYLAAAEGGLDAALERLESLDANVLRPYADDERAALLRLDAPPVGGLAVVGMRALALHREALGEEIGFREPWPVLVAIPTGAALLAEAEDDRVLEVLCREQTLLALAAADHRIPIGAALDADGLSDTARPYRALFAGEAPRIAQEIELAAAVAARYRAEVMGRVERRRAVFDEYFDALGIAALFVFIIWMLRRKEREEDAELVS